MKFIQRVPKRVIWKSSWLLYKISFCAIRARESIVPIQPDPILIHRADREKVLFGNGYKRGQREGMIRDLG